MIAVGFPRVGSNGFGLLRHILQIGLLGFAGGDVGGVGASVGGGVTTTATGGVGVGCGVGSGVGCTIGDGVGRSVGRGVGTAVAAVVGVGCGTVGVGGETTVGGELLGGVLVVVVPQPHGSNGSLCELAAKFW